MYVADIGSIGASFLITEEPMTGEHLHKAVSLLEDVQRTEDILENNDIWVDVPDKMGASPLMVASQRGNEE